MRQDAVKQNGSTNVTSHGFMMRNILSLFQRALRQLRGNVGLWLEFATFSYSHGNYRLLSETLSHALQFNPNCAGLWAFTATSEYRRRGDISAARRLLLRGLRSCGHCPALSQQYFRLEMTYLIDMEKRRLLLGLRDHKNFEDQMKAVARAIFGAALLRHRGDCILYEQLIGNIKSFRDEYNSSILHEINSLHLDIVRQNNGNDRSECKTRDDQPVGDTTISKHKAHVLCSQGPIVCTEKRANMIDTLRHLLRSSGSRFIDPCSVEDSALLIRGHRSLERVQSALLGQVILSNSPLLLRLLN